MKAIAFVFWRQKVMRCCLICLWHGSVWSSSVAVQTLITLRDSQGLGSLRVMYSNTKRPAFLFLSWVYINTYMNVSRCAGCPDFSVVVVVVVGLFHNFNKKVNVFKYLWHYVISMISCTLTNDKINALCSLRGVITGQWNVFRTTTQL